MIGPSQSPVDRLAHRVLCGLLASLVVVWADDCEPAHAQDLNQHRPSDEVPVRSARVQLAHELAVVAAHEGALQHLPETALVWQVVEHNGGETTAKRLSFLRRHSGRALGRKPCFAGRNCHWSVDLLRAPDRPPTKLNAEWWDVFRKSAWQRVRQYARDLVFGRADWRPCASPPRTWGYVGDIDFARSKGLVPMGCVGVNQDGFTYARSTVSAREAAGR